jgi:hypothetical protein
MKKKQEKKKKYTPRKIHLIKEPDWKNLKLAKTEEERMRAWELCEQFVHFEVTDKEYIHSTRKWIRDFSGWNMYPAILEIPDAFLATIAKHGWKAYTLGFMPEAVQKSFKTHLEEMLSNVPKLRNVMEYETPIHPTLADLDSDETELHPNKVKRWIETWKKQATKIDDVNLQQQANTYLYNMQIYLKTGVWLDTHFGENREKKIYNVCVAPAYDADGLIKRSVGVYYRDIGMIWKGTNDET